MTTFDEELMKRALQEAADDFTVSDGAVERILDKAREAAIPNDSPRLRSFIQRNGRGRSTMLAVAACVVLLAVAVPLVASEVTPQKRFDAVPDVHANSKKIAVPGASGLVISGTGFASGQVVNTGSPTLSVDVAAPSKHASATSPDGSLRVEEIGTIQLSVSARNFQSALTQLTDFATTDGGFVASTRTHIGTKATHSYSTGTITLQVPERNFAMLVSQVRHAGDATSVATSATDVTGQYVNLQARINALQVSRAQYLEIMTKTTTIGGILSVQDQLNSIQSQIEQLQAQLNLLNTETTYATLTVAVSEAGHPVVLPSRVRTGVDKAWHDSLHGFAAGVEWLISIAGPLLFALLVLAVLLLLGGWSWRATERRRGGIS